MLLSYEIFQGPTFSPWEDEHKLTLSYLNCCKFYEVRPTSKLPKGGYFLPEIFSRILDIRSKSLECKCVMTNLVLYSEFPCHTQYKTELDLLNGSGLDVS